METIVVCSRVTCGSTTTPPSTWRRPLLAASCYPVFTPYWRAWRAHPRRRELPARRLAGRSVHQPWRYAAAPAGYRREPPRTAAVRHPGEVGVMDSMRYVIILAACVVVTLPLEFVLGARVYRRPKLLIATLAPIAGVFLAWDLIATARGHWWFTDRYLLGPRPLGLPIEEWLFFLVVPACAVLTFEAVGRLMPAPRRGDPVGGGGRG